eukprot:100693_1
MALSKNTKCELSFYTLHRFLIVLVLVFATLHYYSVFMWTHHDRRKFASHTNETQDLRSSLISALNMNQSRIATTEHDQSRILSCYHGINGYTYTSLILNQIKSILNQTRKPYTTAYIDQHLRHKYTHKSHSYMRVKYHNGQLYEDTSGKKGGYQRLYRNYFTSLFQNYTKHINVTIPNFDAIIYMADYDSGEGDWNHSDVIFSNFGVFDKRHALQLLTIPRSIIKLFFGSESKYFAEYLKYSQYRNYSRDTKINQFFMRGTPRHKMRRRVTWLSNNPQNRHYNIKMNLPPRRPWRWSTDTRQFGGCKHWIYNNETNCWDFNFTTTKEEMRYRYIVSIDGIATRDALARTLQYKDTVNIMYNSSKYEFWYLDLKDNNDVNIPARPNVIQFNDASQYLNITQSIINDNNANLDRIANNAHIFSKTYLNLDNVNCFVLEMFKIYATYFFDSSSVRITDHDTLRAA